MTKTLSVHEQASINHVAIAILCPKKNHVGIIYKTSEGVFLCHLAWHKTLIAKDNLSEKYRWVDIDGLDEYNAVNIPLYIKNVLCGGVSVPYGFNVNGDVFDHQNQQFIPPPTGEGFTCVSFIISLFKSFFIDLVDIDSWKVRHDDKAWQQEIIEIMQRSGEVEQTHINALSNFVGEKRVRPLELVGGVTQKQLPANFSDAERAGREIGMEIDNLFNQK